MNNKIKRIKSLEFFLCELWICGANFMDNHLSVQTEVVDQGRSLQIPRSHGSFMCCHQVFVCMNYVQLFAPLKFTLRRLFIESALLMWNKQCCHLKCVSHSPCMSCGMAYHSLGSETRTTSSTRNCVSNTAGYLRAEIMRLIVLRESQDLCLWLCCSRPTVEAKNQDISTSAASFVNFNDKHNYFN